ncbi:MAG TPA: hypothetical protein VMU21_01850, partial [Thermodesulfovibrionales bacterium]|nr:hypothetical protein [Thermodesulfovibrionales bacterium]
DEIFVYAFSEIVPPLVDKFRPDVVVSQLGVDSFSTDPLTHLNYSQKGFCEVVKKIKEVSQRWVALGGGGYDVFNVAKAWTLAWGIMNGVDVPDEIPRDFLLQYPMEGFQSGTLRDRNYTERGETKEVMWEEVERVVGYLRGKVL